MPDHDTGDHAQRPDVDHKDERTEAAAAGRSPAAVGDQPPLSNRGDETETIPSQLVHWLSVTVHGLPTARVVRAVLSGLYPDLPSILYPKQWEEYGVTEAIKLRWWNEAYQFPVVGLYVRGAPKDGGNYSQVEFTGHALETLTPAQVRAILFAIRDTRITNKDGLEVAPTLYATRVDVPFDGAPFTVKEALACVETGAWSSYGRKLKASYARNELGETAYAGSKTADRRLCIYDRRGYVRCEYRAKDDYANELLASFLTDPAGVRNAAQCQLASWIDHVKGETATAAYWWLVEGATPAPNARAAVRTTVRQRGPQARLRSYVEKMLPYVRLWLEVTGTAPQTLLDWPLTPRAEVMQRLLVPAINAKGR